MVGEPQTTAVLVAQEQQIKDTTADLGIVVETYLVVVAVLDRRGVVEVERQT